MRFVFVFGIREERREALVVGQMMCWMEGEERRRGTRRVPMLPVAEVMRMFDIVCRVCKGLILGGELGGNRGRGVVLKLIVEEL